MNMKFMDATRIWLHYRIMALISRTSTCVAVVVASYNNSPTVELSEVKLVLLLGT